MHKNILAVLMTLFFSVGAFAQQTATIKGKITLPSNEHADNVSVALKGSSIGTVTDASGDYEIKNLKPGNYLLRVSLVGYETKEKNLTLKAGEELIANFTLTANAEQIGEVNVNGKNTFARKESRSVSKMPLKNIENPQVYTTISNELLKEQVITNFDDALKNAPGITQLWESTGRGGDGAGYFSLRGFAVQPTMINGLPGLTNGAPDPANIERIEVIKGPSGTLYGSSLISYGGLINITTKKPYSTLGGELSYTTGSYGLNRVTADINTPLSKEEKINFRLNTAYHTQNSFQDAGFRKSFFFAPSLSYEVNDRLSFLVNTEFMQSEGTNPTMLFFDRNAPLRVHNFKEFAYDYKRSYTSNDITIETPTFNLQAQMNYKLSDNWTSQTAVSRGSAQSKGLYSYLYESSQYYPGLTEGVVMGRYMSHQNVTTLTTDIQQNFIGDFKIGSLRNRMVVGVDYFTRNVTDNSTGYSGNGSIYIGSATVENVNNSVFGITDPALYITTGDSGILSETATETILATSPVNNYKTKEEVYSAYVSDVINFTPSLSAMASLRIDRFINSGDISTESDDYNQTAFSPKFGLVYQPILDKVSVFANYMNGFVNVAPGSDRINGIQVPRTYNPEKANQFEFGTKLNLLNDKLTASISYYDTKVDNTVYSIQLPYVPTDENPTPPAGYVPDEVSFQSGAQHNKGFETEIVANPINGLNIVAGYSYSNSRLTEGDPDFVGKRPESAGPRNLANLWVSYKFTVGKLNGLGLGFGGNYASENKIMNRNLAGAFTIPDYTVINATAFYGIRNYLLSFKLDNIANREYYNGWSTVTPQQARTFAASFTYKF
ncbi:TonB-dependent siderophore receptor [Flavobacterium sp.]|uniref:TonB-dependent siderophore receptor n=1 Tax=Flavobacterium sp. TaxID=239 RepID=UPI0039E4770C